MTKNKFILKSVSLFLSFWMLIASAGLSMNFHYCEGEIVDWSIFSGELECEHDNEQQVESCCEADFHSECLDVQDFKFEKSNCCDTDEASVSIESEFDLSNSKAKINMPQLIILSQIVVPELCKEQHEFRDVLKESPPILYTSEQSFIQSFLI
ncbi:MAG: HYC_CC_PP family protein [Flavobacteriales bacterium]